MQLTESTGTGELETVEGAEEVSLLGFHLSEGLHGGLLF
jgi:hypothetical protein